MREFAHHRAEPRAPRSEMSARFEQFDWSTTSIGNPAGWPQSWRHVVQIMLDSSFPACVGLGPELCFFYNDAFIPIGGPARHPSSIGQPVPHVWKEIWDTVIRPRFEHTLSTGEPTGDEEFLFLLERSDYLEETYISFSFAALRDDEGRPNGIFCPCYETTARVIAERQLKCLRGLAARSSFAETLDAACELAMQALTESSRDLPFALLYLLDASEHKVRLASWCGFQSLPTLVPRSFDLRASSDQDHWALARVARDREAVVIERLETLLVSEMSSAQVNPTRAIATPIRGGEQMAGILVAATNPLRPLDESRAFHCLVANHLETAMSNARAKEHVRQRAQALAELDRAKTAFFSNVSHEFRTPLTLLLGPVQDVLTRASLSASDREALEMARRAAGRLLKLVNSLLEFSRIEAGRTQAAYRQTDLACLTANLASVFRSAFDKAGLKLTVDCPPLAAPVYVDHDMWEKIVLNLISNAFKFTFQGEVCVRQRLIDDHVQLEIADTGTGIDARDLARLFERFYRGRASQARTHEGSGIGLSLVHELVKLHGGVINVTSEIGRGTTMTVRIPCGHAHLPSDQLEATPELARTEINAFSFVEEAIGWLPDKPLVDERPHAIVDNVVPARARNSENDRAYILVVDDNADMRDYLQRLLHTRWEVEAAADGAAALQQVHTRIPDLLIADVMMPGLDGFGLLQALREDERTAHIPVMLLSARAGEEASAEGLHAGADDYLIKPFAARELIARVESRLMHVKLRAAERRAREIAEEANRAKDEFLAMLSHELRLPLTAIQGWMDLLRERIADPAALHALEVISQNVFAQRRLIDDLLDVSRIAAGRFSLELQHISSLEPLVSTTVESFRPLALAKGVDLRFMAQSKTGPMRGDPGRIQQVISNLLSNAIAVTPSGGHVVARCTGNTQAINLTVTDSGPGIPPQNIPHVFERFWRAEDAQQTRPGLGLGLAIAKGIVTMHGGHVSAASEGAGRGACFTVSFPVEHGDSSVEISTPSLPTDPLVLTTPGVSHATIHILLAEDHEPTAKAFMRLLKGHGYNVTHASGIDDAIAAATEKAPDVLISDLTLADGSGLQLIERIRPLLDSAHSVLEPLPAIALGGAGNDQQGSCLAAGFSVHLPKPLDGRTLLRSIEEITARLQALR